MVAGVKLQIDALPIVSDSELAEQMVDKVDSCQMGIGKVSITCYT